MMNKIRCEGWYRHGGVFTLGPVKWVQCDQPATMTCTVRQDGETETWSVCARCHKAGIDEGLNFLETKSLGACHE